MKSNKQRRAEIKQLRLDRARRVQKLLSDGAGHSKPAGVEVADMQRLKQINNGYFLPTYYIDKGFACADCGSQEVWTAKQQKWWYETVGASIDSRAVRCLTCRRARRVRKQAALAVHGANLLAQEIEALRALGAATPNEYALQQVQEALKCKWWGHRVVAIQVLGCWGGPEQVAQLRAMVAERTDGGRRYFLWENVAARQAQTALADLGITLHGEDA
jgi:hypothetical protein